MNKIILTGRLVSDPERRAFNNGDEITEFRMAVQKHYNNKEADYFPCRAHGKTGEFVYKWYKKGDGIAVEGRMEIRNVKTNAGWQTYPRVLVDSVEFNGPRSKDEKTDEEEAHGGIPDGFTSVIDADIPF